MTSSFDDQPQSVAGPSALPAPPSVPKPYAKGHRSSSACDACHARKTRCSGDTPCKFCQTRNIPCVVSDSATRIASASAKRPRKSSTASSNTTPGPSAKRQNSANLLAPNDSEHQTRSNSDVNNSNFNSQTYDPVPLASIIAGTQVRQPSGLTPPSAIQRSPHGTTSYHQPVLPQPPNLSPSIANNASLAEPSAGIPDNEYPVSGIVLTRYQRPPTTIVECSVPQLIDRRSSVKYFDAYFSEAEWLYQLFPLREYISAYHEAIWAAEDNSVPVAMTNSPVGISSILAAVLALGALFERKFEDSERLYQAARQSYLDIIDLATLESVQLALQLAVFEINSSRSKSVWSSLAVAVRLSHYLNLHRKPALAGKGPDESLRRCQLWYNCFVHDCWLSLTSGRPALAADGDSDLDAAWVPPAAGQPRLASSPIFGMRVRLSALWTNVHDQLYRRRSDSNYEIPWLQRLPGLENEFQIWAKDMNSMAGTVATNRPDKKQMQSILLAQAIMRLIMHRSFLIQRSQFDGQQAFAIQQGISEAAVLDGALTVIDTCKRLIQLGIHLSFWFLTVDLQMACLALCEYLQNQHDKPRGTDVRKSEEGLKTAIDLLQQIADSGENPAVGQVLEAVKAVQSAWTYQRTQPSLQLQAQGQTQAQVQNNGQNSHHQQQDGSFLLDNFYPSDPSSALANGSTGFDFFGAPLSDFDWLTNLGAGSNIFDGFVASPAPAAADLAWWIAPRGNDVQQ
ncbi:hypothetical protein P389DRAFT_18623 [Cystobasidium minutum MCA 4210]|uniref:uncharacterized protein n=1 Tax=Cystobasidium minutum MCA 4210 TaxID=1397322 RepID=UPI0034CFDC71|eukprot:jgi/Rhomi1/18623/CE18622_842